MEERARKIENIFFKLLLIGIILFALFFGSLYWLLQTDSGREILIEQVISRLNTNQNISFEVKDIKSNRGRLSLQDIKITNKEKKLEIVQIDSLKTGVVLSSLFQKRIQVPQLAIYGTEIDSTFRLSNFIESSKVSSEQNNVIFSSLWENYLKSFEIVINAFDFELKNLTVNRSGVKQINKFALSFEYIQVGNGIFYSVLNDLNIQLVSRSDRIINLRTSGQIYFDKKDFELNNFIAEIEEDKLHFSAKVFDWNRYERNIVSSQSERFPRILQFQLYDDSYLSMKSLSSLTGINIPGTLENDQINLSAKFGLLASVGKLNIENIHLSHPYVSIDTYGTADLSYPNNLQKPFANNRALFNYTIAINDELLKSIIPNNVPYKYGNIFKIEGKSNIYNNELRSNVNILTPFDTLNVNQSSSFSFDTLKVIEQDVGISVGSVQITDYFTINNMISWDSLRIESNIKNNENSIVSRINNIKYNTFEFPSFEFKADLNTDIYTSKIEAQEGKVISELLVKDQMGKLSFRGESTAANLSLGHSLTKDYLNENLLDFSFSHDFIIDKNSGELDEFTVIGVFDQLLTEKDSLNAHSLEFSYKRIEALGDTLDTHQVSLNHPAVKMNGSLLGSTDDLLHDINNLKNYTTSLLGESTDIDSSYNSRATFTLELGDAKYLSYFFRKVNPDFWEGDLKLDFVDVENSFSLNVSDLSFSKNDMILDDFNLNIVQNLKGRDHTATSSLFFDLLNVNKIPVKNFSLFLNSDSNSIRIEQRVEEFIQNAIFDYDLLISNKQGYLNFEVDYFTFGNSNYGWVNDGDLSFLYDYKNDFFDFKNISFKNSEEKISVSGSYQKLSSDLIRFSLQDVDLTKLSDLIQARLPFAGILDGNFSVSSNLENPFFEGRLDIDSLSFRGRTMGDLSLQSIRDTLSSRFVSTLKLDSDRFSNIPKQTISGNGFFQPINSSGDKDTLAYFSLDFEDLNLWMLPSFAVNVFDSANGRASGYGELLSLRDRFDYSAFFSVDSVYAKPKFINTDYYLSGPIYWNRAQGIVIDTVIIDDPYGNGKLWGVIDLNDFQEEKFFNLNLELNNLQFMNNTFDIDVPFYGNLRGSGNVQLQGSSLSPTISTLGVVEIGRGSKLSLPLLSETEFDGEKSYIKYTSSFNETGLTASELFRNTNKSIVGKETIFSRTITNNDRKFVDFFNLELQFDAPDDTQIELIFDDVANEILRANGSGNVRVGLSDKQLQITGTYTLNSGVYDFVSADFFTRRFRLQDKGTLTWDGDPTNAQIDVSAVYNQRADFSAFLGNNVGTSNGIRIPIDMVLELSGRLQSIENDYYFRLPSNFELSSNRDLIENVLTSVNNEQFKLYQATSFLLTGTFLPVEGATTASVAGANQSVISNIQQNPDALIAPLLSGQINSLLNTNLSSVMNNVEFDINMATLDQIDLGVALRLFQDRLTIRRNSSVATAQNDVNAIGDIDANFQLNNQWSLLLFHRQDPLFSDISSTGGQQFSNSQTLNGVGVEWQQQFNSWKEIGKSIKRIWWRIIRKNENMKESDSSDSSQNLSIN